MQFSLLSGRHDDQPVAQRTEFPGAIDRTLDWGDDLNPVGFPKLLDLSERLVW